MGGSRWQGDQWADPSGRGTGGRIQIGGGPVGGSRCEGDQWADSDGGGGSR